MKTETIVVEGVDVTLLKEQKNVMLKLSNRYEGKTLGFVRGIISLMDIMLDSSSDAIENKDEHESKMLEEFNKHFTEINPKNLIQFTELYKKGNLYAFDLRDGSDFKIEPEHEILHMITSGTFIFGKEKKVVDIEKTLNRFYNFCMDNHNGMLREEAIADFLESEE